MHGRTAQPLAAFFEPFCRGTPPLLPSSWPPCWSLLTAAAAAAPGLQIKHLIRAVKEADERLLSRGAAAVNDQGVQTDDGYETEYETCSSGSAEDA